MGQRGGVCGVREDERVTNPRRLDGAATEAAARGAAGSRVVHTQRFEVLRRKEDSDIAAPQVGGN